MPVSLFEERKRSPRAPSRVKNRLELAGSEQSETGVAAELGDVIKKQTEEFQFRI